MHEMSIVEDLLQQVRQELDAHPLARVRRIQLRVGSMRQIVPDMLKNCFEAAVRGTPLEGARVEIRQVDAEARCRKCSLTFHVEENWFECPRCGTLGAELLQGNELELTSLDLVTGDYHHGASAA